MLEATEELWPTDDELGTIEELEALLTAKGVLEAVTIPEEVTVPPSQAAKSKGVSNANTKCALIDRCVTPSF